MLFVHGGEGLGSAGLRAGEGSPEHALGAAVEAQQGCLPSPQTSPIPAGCSRAGQPLLPGLCGFPCQKSLSSLGEGNMLVARLWCRSSQRLQGWPSLTTLEQEVGRTPRRELEAPAPCPALMLQWILSVRMQKDRGRAAGTAIPPGQVIQRLVGLILSPPASLQQKGFGKGKNAA